MMWCLRVIIEFMFKLKSEYQPSGDQPKAIEKLIKGIESGHDEQVLLGVTGSGKTFTIANVIQHIQKPTLVFSHNKTLAAQLYQEFRDFFPDNAVCYFVSYYDYYQPEAYMPATDTYIEKETDINADIDKLRLAATANLLARKDVIVVASVSCIYNLGSPVTYEQTTLNLVEGMVIDQRTLMTRLRQLLYTRNDQAFIRGTFRVRGDMIDLYPAYQDFGLRFEFNGDHIERMSAIDPLTGMLPEVDQDTPSPMLISERYKRLTIYPARHYLTKTEEQDEVYEQITKDMVAQVEKFKQENKLIEAQRIGQRVTYDMEMLKETGFINGIENYSRYFDGRQEGDPPYSLLDFFNHSSKDWLCVIDESHITVPQIRGMYNGDRARKQVLIDFGFRLPAALDNRPLKFDEVFERLDKVIYTSATPNDWEIDQSEGRVAEQLIRPTGLLDPIVEVRETKGQIQDLYEEIEARIKVGERAIVLTLTKRMAEDLSKYLEERKVKVNYLHSEVDTLERTDILQDLRRGEYDVIVGVNLLREGIDLPEVSLVAILDADREGFLRSTTSLMQIMGRAARHQAGKVIMYADRMTKSMDESISEVQRRRELQEKYNKEMGIEPKSVSKPIRERLVERTEEEEPQTHELIEKLPSGRHAKADAHLSELLMEDVDSLTPPEKKKLLTGLRRKMAQASKELNFELAAEIRDRIREVEGR